MEKTSRDHGWQLLESVTARAANDPDKPIRASSPEFAEIPGLLTTPGWEWMLDEDIDHYGLAGSALLYAEDSTEACAAFARDCWEIYCSNNAFKVGYLMYLPELLLREVGGVEVVKLWLKRVYVTVHMSEVKENRSGWVRQTLEGLMRCERLEEVTIELTSENEGDRDLMRRVLAEEVRPVANQLRERVLDECIEVRHVNSWWSSGKIADWQIVSGPWGQSERARGLFRVHYERDVADRRKRVKQFQ
jgi:DNA-binding Lrp family transcriptional regulator